MGLDAEELQAFPKVSLHDHLDGGLRPQTIIELAADIGHVLPADNADDLGRWFAESANSGSLVRYLETFDQTLAVMQTAQSLRRVAAEFVADLAADGVVYGEVRWAPEQHLSAGLTLTEAVEWRAVERAGTRSKYGSWSPPCARPNRLATSPSWR